MGRGGNECRRLRAERGNLPWASGRAGSGGRTRRRSGGEIAGGNSLVLPDFRRIRRRVSELHHGLASLRSSGLAGNRWGQQRAGYLMKESSPFAPPSFSPPPP